METGNRKLETGNPKLETNFLGLRLQISETEDGYPLHMAGYFENKVVVVTGGTDGIGRALIDQLMPMGAKVATCGRHYDKLYNLQMQYSNVLLHAVTCDVSIAKECERFIESTVNTFGGIDILINNAGVSRRALVKDLDVQVIRKVMDVNFFGAVYCTKYSLPH